LWDYLLKMSVPLRTADLDWQLGWLFFLSEQGAKRRPTSQAIHVANAGCIGHVNKLSQVTCT
jgi:hypothetical protein